MLLQEFDEREIAVLISLFEHVAEIAARLVSVDQQGEMEALGHGDSFSLRHHTVWRNFSDSGDEASAKKERFGLMNQGLINQAGSGVAVCAGD
jgi:hypothetical protein